MNSIPVLNSTSRSLAGDAGRWRRDSEPRPAASGSSLERYNYNFEFASNTNLRDVAPPDFGFARRGIPLSPLHDV